MQDTFDVIARAIASPCAMPLRTFALWATCMVMLAPLGHWYTKRVNDRAEILARTKRIVCALVALNGAFLMQHFTDICHTSPACRAGVDLNCSGINPTLYRGAALLAVIVTAALLLSEVVRRMRVAR